MPGATAPVYPGASLGSGANRVATGTAEKARDLRWELLRWQWEHSTLKRLRSCRRCGYSEWVGLQQNEAGAYWTGLVTCGSVWSCPVCSAIIRTRRAQLIEDTAKRWDELGGWLVFLTLTVRHHRGERLGELYDQMGASWKRLQQSRWWRSLSWSGFWRSTEVTWGGTNGWHPHMHFLLFGEGDDVRDRLPAISVELGERWRDAVVAVGMAPTTVQRGAVFELVKVGGPSLGDYLSKDIGSELARSDRKVGRGERHAPMQLLVAAADGEAWAAPRWWEYEQATFGRRAIESSRGLCKRLGVDDQADEDLVAEDEGGEPVMLLLNWQYRLIAEAGYAAEVLKVAEQGDGPATVRFVDALLRLLAA